jgi:glycosyltransferase involved in cell wall biosynthesis
VKVLLSAYACAPGRGSESDIGFQTLLQYAAHHDVWLLTRANNVPPLREFLETDYRRDRITLEGYDLGNWALRVKRLGLPGLMWYYDRWQKGVAEAAVELDSRHDFDVLHHITFAAYWMRAGLAKVGKPLVWGPVGGGVEPPWKLITELGLKGLLEDLIRITGRRLLARSRNIAITQRVADYIFVNNPQTAARVRARARGTIEVLPNPVAVDVLEDPTPGPPEPEILFVGRLIPWKGAHLAIRTMRYVKNPAARLAIIGDGPDRRRLSRRIRRWGLEDRVELVGRLPRSDVLRRMSRSIALLHPALHEEGGNVVAEAQGMGVPVVCLDHGGPPQTAKLFPEVPSFAVIPSTPRATARSLATTLDALLANPQARTGQVYKPAVTFGDRLLRAAELVAGGYDGSP